MAIETLVKNAGCEIQLKRYFLPDFPESSMMEKRDVKNDKDERHSRQYNRSAVVAILAMRGPQCFNCSRSALCFTAVTSLN